MASCPPSTEHPTSIPEIEASPLERVEGSFDGQPVLITDLDLLEQIQNAPSNMRAMMIRMVSRTQAERNQTRERRDGMTPIQRRRDVVREEISENPREKADIHHIHSVLALCGLPYKRPLDDTTVYRRQYGRTALTVHSGDLADPYTGKVIPQGLPYGPKARLLMLHICTRALRQKSPVVVIEDSLSAFIRSLGFPKAGGKKGPYNQFKEQLNRLAASSMQMMLWNGGQSLTINTHPISSFNVWLPLNPDQKMLWNSSVTLSHDFYDSLQKHALPVDIRAIAALSHSAKQMDMLLWMAYRLKELNKPYFLTWDLMKDQFCQSEQRRLVDFQRQFKQDIADIEEIFSKTLPVELTDKGLILKPCDPEGFFIPPGKKLIN